MGIAILWIVLSFVAGAVGNSRKIGFVKPFFLSIFLTPLVGIIIAFNSEKEAVIAPPSPAMDKLIKAGDKLVKDGHIDDAIEKYQDALPYAEKAPVTNFKLAKLYSLRRNSKLSLKHLSLSIQDGFKDFKEINNCGDLNHLRESSEFKTFKANNYKMLSGKSESTRPLNRIEELEKLNLLFEKEVLSKEEFEKEKKRILSSDN